MRKYPNQEFIPVLIMMVANGHNTVSGRNNLNQTFFSTKKMSMKKMSMNITLYFGALIMLL